MLLAGDNSATATTAATAASAATAATDATAATCATTNYVSVTTGQPNYHIINKPIDDVMLVIWRNTNILFCHSESSTTS